MRETACESDMSATTDGPKWHHLDTRPRTRAQSQPQSQFRIGGAQAAADRWRATGSEAAQTGTRKRWKPANGLPPPPGLQIPRASLATLHHRSCASPQLSAATYGCVASTPHYFTALSPRYCSCTPAGASRCCDWSPASPRRSFCVRAKVSTECATASDIWSSPRRLIFPRPSHFWW